MTRSAEKLIYTNYLTHPNRIVLTHGFVKKTQKTPPKEIERAKEYRVWRRSRREEGGRHREAQDVLCDFYGVGGGVREESMHLNQMKGEQVL